MPLLQSAVKFEASVESIRPNQLGISIANETEKSLEEVLAQFSSIEAALDASGYSHIQFTPPALPQGTSQVRKQEGIVTMLPQSSGDRRGPIMHYCVSEALHRLFR